FSRTGFRLRRRHDRTVMMRFADGSALFSHFFVRLGFLDGWKAVVEDSRREKTFARLEENLNRTARVRGELALSIPFAFVAAEPPDCPARDHGGPAPSALPSGGILPAGGHKVRPYGRELRAASRRADTRSAPTAVSFGPHHGGRTQGPPLRNWASTRRGGA